MPTVAEWSRRTYPAPLGAGGVGSIPANPDAQDAPSFRRRRFETRLSPFIIHIIVSELQVVRPVNGVKVERERERDERRRRRRGEIPRIGCWPGHRLG